MQTIWESLPQQALKMHCQQLLNPRQISSLKGVETGVSKARS
jgi:hypothetical protein